VITITLTESAVLSQNDIPKYLTLSTDIPSTIFYTLDGSDPTIDSYVYVDRVDIPTQGAIFTLKFWATNGSDSSDVLTKTYEFSFINTNLRGAKITNFDKSIDSNWYPFGNFAQPTPPVLGGVAGTVVRNLENPPYPEIDGYDAEGQPLYLTDKPITDYLIVYSETDIQGNVGRGIGTMTGQGHVRLPSPIPEISSTSQKLFDPRAFVFYMSSADPVDPNISLTIHERWTGQTSLLPGLVTSNGYHANTFPGSAVRQQWNSRDSTMTYYYFDSKNLKWIINKEAIIPQSSDYSQIVTDPRGQGAGQVFRWYPFFANRGY